MLGVITVTVLVVRGEMNRKDDEPLYARMLDDPALALVPPDAQVLERSSIPPCEGDSATGPTVVLALSTARPVDEVLEFHREGLEELGWTGVRVDGSELTGHRQDNGHDLEARAYSDSFEDVDSWFVLSADPRQNCLLPIV